MLWIDISCFQRQYVFEFESWVWNSKVGFALRNLGLLTCGSGACQNERCRNFAACFTWRNARDGLQKQVEAGREDTYNTMHRGKFINGHTGDWTQGLPHAERVWYHYTMCPMKECFSINVWTKTNLFNILKCFFTSNVDGWLQKERNGPTRAWTADLTFIGRTL